MFHNCSNLKSFLGASSVDNFSSETLIVAKMEFDLISMEVVFDN